MSFILDALKKSEAERQRQSGPTLLELRITQPRRRYPVWAMWVGVLLVVNVAVLLYALPRRTPAVPTATTVATTQPLAGTAAARITVAPAPTPAPLPTPAPPPAPAAATATTSADSTVAAASQAPVSAVAPLAATGAPGPAGVAAPSSSANPVDDEPAVPAAPNAPVARYAELPSAASLGGDLPSLQLNLLASSNLASERYALINMHRVREGDILPEGPRVLAITRQGVAMDYHGQQFMLRPSGGAAP
ncbi:MAG TPA: general secretion pathway protein GspB [Steroidobacteraceae bacterium]|nr:general secretion pathway protein GspB [Steroidobacteraceae bacterium]